MREKDIDVKLLEILGEGYCRSADTAEQADIFGVYAVWFDERDAAAAYERMKQKNWKKRFRSGAGFAVAGFVTAALASVAGLAWISFLMSGIGIWGILEALHARRKEKALVWASELIAVEKAVRM